MTKFAEPYIIPILLGKNPGSRETLLPRKCTLNSPKPESQEVRRARSTPFLEVRGGAEDDWPASMALRFSFEGVVLWV